MKQKLTLMFLCFAMVLSLCTFLSFGTFAEDAGAAWDGSVATAYPDGSGTPEDPYQIANGAQLALMAQQINAGENASASFVLVNDINLNNIAWTPIGILQETAFKGSFDGNGKTISGLFIETSDVELYTVGLFGVLDGATVSNLTISAGSVKGQYNVGAIAGMAANSAISGVTNSGVNVKAQTDTKSKVYFPNAGGIIGYVSGVTSIIDCHTTSTVTIFARNTNGNSSYNMTSFAGGIVGEANGTDSTNQSIVKFCTSAATVQGRVAHGNQTQRLGGIVGFLKFTIVSGCTSTGVVQADAYGKADVGGIVGSANSGAIITNISKATLKTNQNLFSANYNQDQSNGGIFGWSGTGGTGTKVHNNLSMATQIKGKDTDKVGRIGTGFTGGGRNDSSYNYYTAYEIDGAAVPGYTGYYNSDELKNGNFAVTEEQLKGTATDIIDTVNSKPKYANTTSAILAMNRYAKAQGYGSTTVAFGENGPEIYGTYEPSYSVTTESEFGSIVFETAKPAIFPEGYAELVSGYKEGQNVVVSLVPAEGYVPYKLEYTFDGKTEELQKDELGKYSFKMPAGEVTLSAIFAEAGLSTELKVIFLGKDGAIIDEQIVSYKDAATAPEAPVVEGYDFIGWDIAFDEVKTDLIVNAVYQIQTYTVIFYDSLGNVLSEQAVDYGFAAVAPEAPAVEGHIFGGWDYAFDFVKGDMTITATYKKIYTVTFLGFGGVVLGEPQSVIVGESALAPEAPVVEGYDFEGWDADFTCITGDLTVNAIYAFSGNFFSGGKGTANDPWQIGTAKDLYDLNNYITNPDTMDIFVSACYELIADIDLTNVADLWDDPAYSNFFVKDKKGALAQNWLPIPTFSGSIDGNGYTISNLIIKNALQDQAMFSYFGGSLKNLTMKDCHVSTGSNYGYRAIIAAYTQGTLVVENCHVIDAKIGSGNNASLMFGTATGTSVTIKGCTVSGSVVESGLNLNVGGFFAICKATTFIDCTSSLVVDNRNIKQAGGFVGGCNDGVTFENCISLAKISIDSARTRGSNIGGFAGWIDNNSTVSANNCTFSGILENNDSGSSAAAGFSCSVPANRTTVLTNIAIYGSVYGRLTSGGIFASVGNNQTIDLKNILVLAELSTSDVGLKGAVAASLNPKAGTKFENIYIASEDVMVDSANASVSITYNVLTSLTTLPEGLSSDVWAIDAMPVLSGVSVSLGNNMSINVFAKVGIVLKAHVGKLYVDGQFITAGEKVMLGATEYVKFIYDGFKVADMDKALKLSLVGYNAVQKEYAITTYITNVYGAEDGKYQPLLDAILYYGDAAQKAKYGTSTVLATAASKLEKEFSADYVATNFTKANLKTHAGLSAAGIALNLYGNITPILKVDASVEEVTVSYNGKTATMATQLAVDEDGNEYAYVIYTELLATSLNNLMTVSYTLDGEEVSFDTNIAMYIETALNTQDLLTDNEANLAKALAVYMRAARTFVGLE